MKTLCYVFALMAFFAGMAMAADSPQFRGPNRDGILPEQGLLKQWPDSGPAVAWVATGIGKGYSSVSIADGKIYTTGMLENDMGHVFVLSLDGKVENKAPYGKETLDEQAPGPRSTPTIDGNRLYILSALGQLCCFEVPGLKKLWEANILERFGAKNNQWNLAESVLIDGNRLICTPGGPDASVAALDKMTGQTLWTSKGLSDASSYCSPVAVTHNGHRLILTETATLVVGLDAESGKVLWTFPHKTDYDIHAVSPTYSNGKIYYTGGYGSGGGLLELSQDGSSVTSKWTDKTLDCQHHGVVLVDGYLYGTAHKGNALVCLEFDTGKVAWTSKEVHQGEILYADGMLYVYEGPKTGIVDLVKASPKGFERVSKFTVTQGTDKHWANPAIANGRLYVRHGDALIAYTIK